jgi:hypothetical protein
VSSLVQAFLTLTSPTPVTIHSVFASYGRRIAEYNETSGALIPEYARVGWEPVAVIGGGVVSFVRTDHIGRPVFASNSTGAKVWNAGYTPFGGVAVFAANCGLRRWFICCGGSGGWRLVSFLALVALVLRGINRVRSGAGRLP